MTLPSVEIVQYSSFSASIFSPILSRFFREGLFYSFNVIFAFITALAAGGILSMVAETMIPKAFEKAQSFIGLIIAAGFLVYFLLMKGISETTID